VNHAFADRFTLAHAAIGAVYGLALPLLGALGLALLWELVENPLKRVLPRVFPHPTKDTLRNAVGDVLAVMSGWAAARFLAGE
jgi:hypothetical protein